MTYLRCQSTGNQYDANDPRWCSDDGGLLDIVDAPSFDPEKIDKSRNGLWRYRTAIPIDNPDNILDFGDGRTPILAVSFYNRSFFAKLDYLFVTGSFKDRGAAALISKVKEIGVKHVVEDSSGNAGSSIAAYCAMAGIGCEIYVSEQASREKLTQIQAYGATVRKIKGPREKVTEAVMDAARNHYYASHYWNPYFFEGTKTYAYELWEQFDRKAPDTLILQVGHGTLLIGAYLGFKDLYQNGYIDKIPKMVVVQPEKCRPLYNHYYELPYSAPEATIGEGINIIDPPRMKQLCDIITDTNGAVMTVSDEDIKDAMLTSATKGIYIEAAAAAVIAAMKNYDQQPGEKVVVSLTGHGLKNTSKFSEFL